MFSNITFIGRYFDLLGDVFLTLDIVIGSYYTWNCGSYLVIGLKWKPMLRDGRAEIWKQPGLQMISTNSGILHMDFLFLYCLSQFLFRRAKIMFYVENTLGCLPIIFSPLLIRKLHFFFSWKEKQYVQLKNAFLYSFLLP